MQAAFPKSHFFSIGTTTAEALVYFCLALLLIALVAWISYKSRVMQRSWLRWILASTRILLIACLVLSLIELGTTKLTKKLAVAVVMDASQSIPDDGLAQESQFISEIRKRATDADVLAFDFAIDSKELFHNELPSRHTGKTGTDISKALLMALDRMPENAFRRIALLTDGNQTEGDLLAAARLAKARSTELYIVPVEPVADRDIAIQSLNLPRRARPGEPVTVTVGIKSNYEADAVLTVVAPGVKIRQPLHVTSGEQTIDLQTRAPSGGNVSFTASLEADGDAHPENNRMSSVMTIIGAPRIAVFSSDLEGDRLLLSALESQRLSVQSSPSSELPANSRSYYPYDLVVLSDIAYKNVTVEQAEALREYVRDYGGGLLVIGGSASADLGEPDELPMESLLPAVFKRKKKTEPNPPALILIIDKSASMARERKFAIAIKASGDSLDALPDESQIGIILFDDFPRWAVPTTKASNRNAIKSKLATFGVDGGTSLYPAVIEAYGALKKVDNKVKHVLILSDGMSLTTFEQYGHVIESMARKKITVSTVALGKESDKAHLRKIAEAGKGRFYYTDNIDEIPKIFMEETKTITKTNIVEARFVPEVIRHGDMLAGLDLSDIPELYGYNAVRSKPGAEVFMTAEAKEPLLMRWRLGLGKVSLLACDTGADWARQWPEWRVYPEFIGHVARGTLGDQNRRNFRVTSEVSGYHSEIFVDAMDHLGNFLNDQQLDLEMTAPDGNSFIKPLEQIRPGGYKADIPLEQTGGYQIRVFGKGEAPDARSEGIGGVTLKPPDEFIATTVNEPLLADAARAANGIYKATVSQLLAEPPTTISERNPWTKWFLYVALAVSVIGVFLRRL